MIPSLDPAFHSGEPLLLRLGIAALAGGAVGWNRFRAGKPAGTGTHALVALGSAIFVAVPLAMVPAHETGGVTRVIQGVVAGIGFLGAGEIFRDPGAGTHVKGLTSAAALWVTASLGILAICGPGLMILAATALVLAVLYVAPWLEHRFPPRARGGLAQDTRSAGLQGSTTDRG